MNANARFFADPAYATVRSKGHTVPALRGIAILLCLLPLTQPLRGQSQPADLPDAPEVLLAEQAQRGDGPSPSPSGVTLLPCPPASSVSTNGQAPATPTPAQPAASPKAPPCPPLFDPYARYVNGEAATPLTVRQKGVLAVHYVIAPANLLTIGFTSAFTIGVDSHTAYGPGVRGWARNAGYSLAQDAQGEFVETFAIASIAHEDPRYHRMPDARPMRRVWHAVAHTFVSRHDDGRPMPNYETLVGFPICAELSNLYVPGLATDVPSTAARVGIGLAANPANDLITEFLPDLASHVHLEVVFVQRVLNQIAAGQRGQ